MTKWIVSLALVSSLCACGGSTSSTDPTHAAAQATGAATSSPAASGPAGAAGAASGTSGATSVGGAVDGASSMSIPDQVCIFFSEETAKLANASSAVRAQSALATHFADWQAKDKNRRFAKKSDLDAISKSRCPKVRSSVLDIVRISSLAKAVDPATAAQE